MERIAFLKVAAERGRLPHERSPGNLDHSPKWLRPAQHSRKPRSSFIPDSPDFYTSTFAGVAYKGDHRIDREVDEGLGLIRLKKKSASC